jgi:hypothetical protein
MALDFTHRSGGIRVAQQGWNLGTASYATISGSGNSVTFETQRLIPASGKPPVGFSLSQWNVVSMRSVICLLLSVSRDATVQRVVRCRAMM